MCCQFEQVMVEKRNTHLQRMRHRHPIGQREQVAGQEEPNLRTAPGSAVQPADHPCTAGRDPEVLQIDLLGDLG
jgi:hypothetical protein